MSNNITNPKLPQVRQGNAGIADPDTAFDEELLRLAQASKPIPASGCGQKNLAAASKKRGKASASRTSRKARKVEPAAAGDEAAGSADAGGAASGDASKERKLAYSGAYHRAMTAGKAKGLEHAANKAAAREAARKAVDIRTT